MLKRRDFLRGAAAGIGAIGAGIAPTILARAADAPRRPNVLFIMTDQQHWRMMSCAGNPYLKTPAMDGLAAAGTRFDLAYAAFPLCIPARVAMVTGRMPSRSGITDNIGQVPEAFLGGVKRDETLGAVFQRAGYETAYGGKVHLPRGLGPIDQIGFQYISKDERDGLADACVEFLGRKHDKPFLLVASFINPHDICYMAIDAFAKASGSPQAFPQSNRERTCLAEALHLPEGVSREEFFRKLCPPVPDNYAIPAGEPACAVAERAFRAYVRQNWTDEDWRLHRWAYCRLTERVDAEIARVLAALRQGGLEENTVVVFTSDHGDMDASHRLEHKSVLYEEAAHVPFIISAKGATRGGAVDRTHLVSAHLDLIPTLCDYAGIAPPAGLPGRSIRPLIEGRAPPAWRDAVAAEVPRGRMIRTARFKYNRFSTGEEQLFDMEKDPGEMTDLARRPDQQAVLDDHRRRLAAWCTETGDTFLSSSPAPAKA